MNDSEPARTAARRTRSTILAALVMVGAALVGVVSCQSLASSISPVASPTSAAAPPTSDASSSGARHHRRSHSPQRPLGVADGAVPDGVTVFDDDIPAVARLDPDLRGALREAATDAGDDGVEFYVNSGWRSREYQEHLLREAVGKYGSKKKAARWVATPDTSSHVSGDAVDIGHSDATEWLSEHGAQYGLCQIYRNEPWHYELRRKAVDNGCPPMYADPTHDPRMR